MSWKFLKTYKKGLRVSQKFLWNSKKREKGAPGAPVRRVRRVCPRQKPSPTESECDPSGCRKRRPKDQRSWEQTYKWKHVVIKTVLKHVKQKQTRKMMKQRKHNKNKTNKRKQRRNNMNTQYKNHKHNAKSFVQTRNKRRKNEPRKFQSISSGYTCNAMNESRETNKEQSRSMRLMILDVILYFLAWIRIVDISSRF